MSERASGGASTGSIGSMGDMLLGRNDPCRCGSGRRFRLCHGRARKRVGLVDRELEALAYVHNLGALLPSLRADGEALEAFADRAAAELEAKSDIPIAVVEEGVALADEVARRRIVEGYAARYPERWRTICGDGGAVAERALVASAVRGTIADRILPPRGLYEVIEKELRDSPGQALALLIRPSLVWSLEDATAAAEAAMRQTDHSGLWFEAVDDVARGRLERGHERRVRMLAGRVAAQLPIARLPRATSLVERGFKEARRSRTFARELAVVLLTSYVVQIGAEAPEYSPN